MRRPRLLFVSPQFLFPQDAGGKIRTANVLRGLKGGHFEVRLISPGPSEPRPGAEAAIAELCDSFRAWPARDGGLPLRLKRVAGLASRLPVSVWSDRRRASRRAIEAELARGCDLVVVDFTHTMVACPERLPVPSVLFTHNVESEIFERHVAHARGPMRLVWRDQLRKMRRFEAAALARPDAVIAVSERDAEHFRRTSEARAVRSIPTGVNLGFFAYRAPPEQASKRLVFTGSMDWAANRDGIFWLLREVWPLVLAREPQARLTVVGKNPPAELAAEIRRRGYAWELTGFVDDVRDHVHPADGYVIPLRVGGGTRIKAYEAAAMGLPIVSTALGVEGLPLEPGAHYLQADAPEAFAEAVLRLLADAALRRRLAESARGFVERSFGHEQVARRFEEICREALEGRPAAEPALRDAV